MLLISRIRETINRYDLLSEGNKVVVGVSGGPDSVALIFLLNLLRKELNLDLHIAHLDHRLRKDSYCDEAFVRSLAQRLNIPFTSKRINIFRLSQGVSVEEVARKVRLEFLFYVADKVGADKIALGHNQDDQAETVLMRLIRGTGLYGLSSILPKRNIGNWVVIRPLIEVPRKSIESYLMRKRIRFRIDRSNKDIVYLRNRIRNRLLPQLSKGYNPNVKQTLANAALLIADDYDYLQNTALKGLKRISRPVRRGKNKNTGIRLNLDKLSRLHLAIQRLLLRLAIARIKGSTRQLSYKHIREIEELIRYRPIKSIVDLPQGICVRKDRKYLDIYQRRSDRRCTHKN